MFCPPNLGGVLALARVSVNTGSIDTRTLQRLDEQSESSRTSIRCIAKRFPASQEDGDSRRKAVSPGELDKAMKDMTDIQGCGESVENINLPVALFSMFNLVVGQ